LVTLCFDIHCIFNRNLNAGCTSNHRRRKYLISDEQNLANTAKWSYENALDLIAVGFKPQDTFIIYDTKDIDLLYDITLEVAKRITYSTARSSFGFQDSTNIGWVYWPAIQAAPCFIHKKLTGENVPALIPAAPIKTLLAGNPRCGAETGYYKPAKSRRFLPGLGAGVNERRCRKQAYSLWISLKSKKRLMLSGGKGTAAEQRVHADPGWQHIPVLLFLRGEQQHIG
jgi:tryptophanyl-tRNA synthetase